MTASRAARSTSRAARSASPARALVIPWGLAAPAALLVRGALLGACALFAACATAQPRPATAQPANGTKVAAVNKTAGRPQLFDCAYETYTYTQPGQVPDVSAQPIGSGRTETSTIGCGAPPREERVQAGNGDAVQPPADPPQH